jgi:hypothetical protein
MGCQTKPKPISLRLKYYNTVRFLKAGSLKMNTALEYSTRVVQEGGRRCKKSTLNDLVHLTPLRIPLMNPPLIHVSSLRNIRVNQYILYCKCASGGWGGGGYYIAFIMQISWDGYLAHQRLMR